MTFYEWLESIPNKDKTRSADALWNEIKEDRFFPEKAFTKKDILNYFHHIRANNDIIYHFEICWQTYNKNVVETLQVFKQLGTHEFSARAYNYTDGSFPTEDPDWTK